MPEEYLDLARERSSARFHDYLQPEDFGYNFRNWISPYTKGAHMFGTVAVVLQDWSSSEALKKGTDPGVQLHGRTIGLKTNRYLEELLKRVFNLSIAETYVTNAFPYIKTGSLSAPVPMHHISHTVERFTRRELSIAQPRVVLALGRLAHASLQRAGIECIGVPHPAARIGGVEIHETMWRTKLQAVRTCCLTTRRSDP